MNHNFLFCLNTEKGYSVLKTIFDKKPGNIGLVCSYPEWNVNINYGNKIKNYCFENDIPYLDWVDLKENYVDYINLNAISGIIAIGWQYLIPIELNLLLADKIIVFHDGLLPKYRGFCPLSTAIMKGDTNIGMSILYASEGIDEGEVILQKKTQISNSTYLQEAISLMSGLYSEGVVELIEMINSNSVNPMKQDNSKATYCIWRNPEDCKICWNESSVNIYNLIRASGFPYQGAYTELDGDIIQIKKAEILDYDLNFEIREPGKIWKLEDGKPIVICKTGLIKITEAAKKSDSSIFPIKKLRLKFG